LKGPLKEVLPQIRQGKEPNVYDRILLGPVRDMRNFEFDVVFLALANEKVYPFAGYRVLPVDENHDKKLFYMAITRCSEELSISWYDKPSRYVTTLQKNI
jgi:superfamily I DNA/RNA helicase